MKNAYSTRKHKNNPRLPITIQKEHFVFVIEERKSNIIRNKITMKKTKSEEEKQKIYSKITQRENKENEKRKILQLLLLQTQTVKMMN